MDQNGVFTAYIVLELTDCLQKRLALDVTDGAADLDDGDLHVIRFLGALLAGAVLSHAP